MFVHNLALDDMTNKQCLNENYWSDNKYERKEKEIGERKKLEKEKNWREKMAKINVVETLTTKQN